MNKLGLIFLISLLLAGCSSPEAIPTVALEATESTPIEVMATETPSPTATNLVLMRENDICQNPYYPIINGAQWTYNISTGTTAAHAMAVAGNEMFTITITGGDDVFTIDGQCTDDGVVLLDVPGISATSGGEGGSTLTTTNLDGVTIPGEIQVGDDWSQTISVVGTSADGEVILSAEIENNYLAVGFETVTVPAGTFNALKVQQTGTMTMRGQSFDTNGFLWYAQGIGTVRSGLDGVYTAELVSYNIP